MLELLEILLENEDIHDIELVSTANTEKGDGYMSEVQFVKVTGTTDKGEKCEYNLVIKSGKSSELFREKLNARSLYENEIYSYRTIIPAFQNLLKENNQPPFDHVPKCFSTILDEGKEYLALENLKIRGYDLHDKNICMDIKHLRLTLEGYAKWHAISFVLKDQNSEKFYALSSELKSIQKEWCKNETNFCKSQEEAIIKLLEEAKEFDLLEKFKAKYSPLYDNWYKQLTIKDPENVVTHGDCWNNNYLFRYKPEDKLKENPLHTVLLDFQLSCLGSPVFDLSYHLFSVCTGKDMDDNLKGLLDLYYASLAENIRKMGSDPDKLFPYSSLIAHWKKYLLTGFMMAMIIVPGMLIDKEDMVDMEEVMNYSKEDLEQLRRKIGDKTKAKREYRVIPLIRHAVEYEL